MDALKKEFIEAVFGNILEGGVRRYFVSLEQIGETVYEKQNV
jgi:hypothetical protein